MCIAETGDVPSLHVVHNLMTKYPHVPVRIFQGEEAHDVVTLCVFYSVSTCMCMALHVCV